LFSSVLALSCPKQAPRGFHEIPSNKQTRLFTDDHQTVVLGLKCESIPKSESYKSVQYFSDRTIINSTTSYYSLKNADGATTRIYFSVHDQELVEAAVTTKTQSKDDLENLEKAIVNFLNES
ncbi:MAG TPA: hypothetical protein VN132_10720, partial [Bdellovibrio sp.]|nr:hypothetical protein [Bdellovibrio sp.]